MSVWTSAPAGVYSFTSPSISEATTSPLTVGVKLGDPAVAGLDRPPSRAQEFCGVTRLVTTGTQDLTTAVAGAAPATWTHTKTAPPISDAVRNFIRSAK